MAKKIKAAKKTTKAKASQPKKAKKSPKKGVKAKATPQKGKVKTKAAPKTKVAPKKAKSPASKKVEAKSTKASKKAVKPVKATKPPRAERVEEKKVAPVLVTEEVSVEVSEAHQQPEEIILTDAEGRRYCRVKDCDQAATVDGYCRYHYLLFWKKIQVRKKILSEGRLERYIEELTARYPDKFLEMLRKDLRSEKEFLAAIQELEIDESASEGDFGDDESEEFIDEVRGISEPGSSSGDEY